MKTNLAILLVILIAVAAYTGYSDHAGKTGKTSYKIAENKKPAPDFMFIDIYGQKHTLAEFKGRGVVLNFWATWCAPCVVEFPALVRLAAQQKETFFFFISLDENDAAIERFLKKYLKQELPGNIHIGRDTNTEISAGLYKTYQLPETYLIDSDGYIAGKIIGSDVDWTSQPVAEKIKSLSRH